MNDWDLVNDNIELSSIKRFNYKSIIGESLIHFVTNMKMQGMNSAEIKKTIIQMPGVQRFLMENPSVKDKFINNINISVSSRCAEQNTLERYNK